MPAQNRFNQGMSPPPLGGDQHSDSKVKHGILEAWLGDAAAP